MRTLSKESRSTCGPMHHPTTCPPRFHRVRICGRAVRRGNWSEGKQATNLCFAFRISSSVRPEKAGAVEGRAGTEVIEGKDGHKHTEGQDPSGDNTMNLWRNQLHYAQNFRSRDTQLHFSQTNLGASAGQLRDSSTSPASHLPSPFCSVLLGNFPLFVVTDEALDIEGIEKGNVPRPIVVPAAPVIRTLDLLPVGVKIDLVILGKEPSGMEKVEDEDVQVHKCRLEDL